MRFILLTLAAAMLAAAQPDVNLQRAIRKETVEGDLKGAIELYRKVIAEAGKNRPAAAQALLHLAECQEKLGQAEARQAYERLVKDFADQKEASTARTRLAALTPGAGSRAMMASRLWERASFDGRITPDGKLLPYTAWATGDFCLRELETDQSRVLVKATGWNQKGDFAEFIIPSRDGRQLIYTWYLDNTYQMRTINIDGTGEKIIVNDRKLRFYSADWSPDGKQVVGWLRREEGNSRSIATLDVASGTYTDLIQLDPKVSSTTVTEIAGYSADGRFLVYAKADPGVDDWDVLSLELATGKTTPLLDGPATDRRPVWASADRILFNSNRNGKLGLWALAVKNGAPAGPPIVIKADAGELVPLGVTRNGGFAYGVFQSTSDIFSASLDPGTGRLAGSPAPALNSYLGRNQLPIFQPDGKGFVYQSRRSDFEGEGLWQMVYRKPDGTEMPLPARDVRWMPRYSWCADGRTVLASITDSRQRNSARIDISTGAAALLPEEPSWPIPAGFQAAFSPDCRTVFINEWDRAEQPARFWKVDLETRKRELLHEGGTRGFRPVVSPDGAWLAFSCRGGFCVLPAGGGVPRQLTASGVLWTPGFSWSADGKRVYYAAKVNPDADQGDMTNAEIRSVAIDGGEAKPTGITVRGLGGFSVSPDGTRVLYTRISRTSELWMLRNIPAQ